MVIHSSMAIGSHHENIGQSSIASLSSFDSESASEVSSLSGDSVKNDDLYATFSQHGLHGRANENLLLEESYKRIQSGYSSEVIFIRGESGFGKSFLVESMRRWVTDRHGYFIAGRFDQSDKSAPFSALTEALSDLCDLINQEQALRTELEESENSMQLFQSELRQRVDIKKLFGLAGLVNNFASIAGIDTIDIEEETASFKESCISFLQAVADTEKQIFIFLDDLQHADEKSLKVIDGIVRKTESKNILLACSCRENESPVTGVIPIFCSEEDKSKLRITNITLRGLDAKSIQRLLSQMLKKDESILLRLSEVILAKTDGNPYFVKKYLHSLRTEGYLRYVKSEWIWDISSITERTSVSDNVVQSVETNMRRLHPDVQSMLKVASCLGFQFPRDVIDRFGLDYLFSGDRGGVDFIQSHFTHCLEVAIQEGIIEPTRNGKKFKFSHIRIQDYIDELLPLSNSEQQTLHLRVGNAAWNVSEDGRREWYVLAAAEQLNKSLALISEKDGRRHVQDVNMRAAKIARSKNAFGPAAEFLEVAISLMNPHSAWRNEYNSMLAIHCMAAEMQMVAGRFKKCDEHVGIVFRNATTIFDKMPAYFVLTESLGLQCKVEEAIFVATKGLSQIGFIVPKQPTKIQIGYELTRVRRLLKGKSDHEILSMRKLKSKKELAAMRLLGSLLSFAISAFEPELVAIVSIYMVKISFTHGISRMTPAALACWSMLNGKGQETINRFGRIALELTSQMNDSSPLLSTIMFAYGFSLYHVPIKNTFRALDEGHNHGIDLGQVFPASLCRIWYSAISLQTGVKLTNAEREARSLCTSLKERNHCFPLSIALPFWQVMLNLLGGEENEDPSSLVGKSVNVWKDHGIDMPQNDCVLFNTYYCAVFLSVIFGDWSNALEQLEKLKVLNRTNTDNFLAYCVYCFEGLVAYEMYRELQKRCFLVRGRQILKILKESADKGNTTCNALFFLIKAEEVATKGNMTDTSKAYDMAIYEFKQCNLLPFQALASERAGNFMLSEKLTRLTEKYFTHSLSLYKQWGARKKVERFEFLLRGLPASKASLAYKESLASRQPFSTISATSPHAPKRYDFRFGPKLASLSTEFDTASFSEFDVGSVVQV